jgi:hypothetical protein
MIMAVLDFEIICAEPAQDLLVGFGEWSARGVPPVPDEYRPAARTEDAREFAARFVAAKPVESLGDGDEMHGTGGECGLLGGSSDARESPKAARVKTRCWSAFRRWARPQILDCHD